MAHQEVREVAVVVRFEGEVDMAVAEEFRSHLDAGLTEASADRPLIIDLQAISFFGSAALNALVRCHDQAEGNGIALGLVASSPIVVGVIHATRLDEILAVYPTIDEALGVSSGVRSAQGDDCPEGVEIAGAQ